MFRKEHFSMPCVQCVIQLAHCILGVISQISKYTMFPMLYINSISFGCSLSGLNARLCFALRRPVTLLGSDASRTDESTFGLLPCGCDRALGQPNGAILEPEDYFTATTFVVRSTVTVLVVLLVSELAVSWRP